MDNINSEQQMADATLKNVPSDEFFEKIRQSRTTSLSDPQTEGVSQEPKPLSEFHLGSPVRSNL
jgi:hypothetical protein